MDAEDEPNEGAVFDPLYYFFIAFAVLHMVAASLLFVRQRSKFPVSGHNISITIYIAITLTATTVGDSVKGLHGADTCTVATIVVHLLGIAAVNILAAQAVRLWFEYNLADEQGQNLQAGIGEGAPPGWFTRKRAHFQAKKLIAIAVGVTLVETIASVGVIVSLDCASFGALVSCEEVLGALAAMMLFNVLTCCFILFIFWRFRNKSDGFGLKSTFKWWVVVFIVFAPPAVALEVVDAFTDFELYTQAIRVTLRFVALEILVYANLGRPIRFSFNEAAHGRMSSISQAHFDDDDHERETVEHVLELAGVRETGADAIDSSAAATSEAKDTSGDEHVQDEAVEVFSSKTLALSIQDILLKPVYAPQLVSFTKHLVGEFSVESLLFFFRVLNFKAFCNENASKTSTLEPELEVSAHAKDGDEPSQFLAVDEQDSDNVSIEDEATAGDVDFEVAWRALLVYLEFLDKESLAEINIGHRVSTAIREDLKDAIVHFDDLPPIASMTAANLELRRPVDPKVFDRAQQSVMRLLERDPFVRWQRAIRDVVDEAPEVKLKI